MPFVAISLDLAEVLAAGREISAPVHVDSSFAVYDQTFQPTVLTD